ncbi:MAG: ribonuclease HII [Acidimicrobiia bacterium]|nr:ribonuclease HII [Acidimicrobiia bacterium]MYB25391.1 ribonuclease HII [Acidimicrobiia bacterium]
MGTRRRAAAKAAPDLARERELWDAGAGVVAGVDEAGRGAWAGPLVVAAAALRAGDPRGASLGEVRDSKQLSPALRQRIFDRLRGECAGWAVGSASAAECDELGMSAAQRLATRRALLELPVRPEALLLDGRWDFASPPAGSPAGAGFDGPVRAVVGGDARCVSVAAASILAKVWRDGLMVRQAARFPGYDFAQNKGYPSPRHRAALAALGASAIHRQSWKFMDRLPADAGRQASPPQLRPAGRR